MQQFLQALGQFFSNPQALGAVVALIVAILPNGLIPQALDAAQQGVTAWAKRTLPQQQYQIVSALAADAVAYAKQKGDAAGWDNPTRATEALTYLKAAASAHGIKLFGDTVLVGRIEAAYAVAKATWGDLVAAASQTSQADQVEAQPTEPAPTPPVPSTDTAPTPAPASSEDASSTASDPTSDPTSDTAATNPTAALLGGAPASAVASAS